MDRRELQQAASRILDEAWQPDLSCCVPNPWTYPHLWLCDSCFHSMAWAALGERRVERRAPGQALLPRGDHPPDHAPAEAEADRVERPAEAASL